MNYFYTNENNCKGIAYITSLPYRHKWLAGFALLCLLFFCQEAIAQSSNLQITPADIPFSNEGPFTKTIGSYVFTFTPATNDYVDYFNDIGTEGFGGLYAYDYNTYDGTEFTLSGPFGYSFDFNSFQYISERGTINLTVTITFADNTTDVKNYTLTGDSFVHAFNSFTTTANDIKSIKLVSDALVYYNNLSVGDIKPISTLPVTWLSITAAKQANYVVLNWQTAMEQNNYRYLVQRSTDGRLWNNIATVSVSASSTNVQSYSYLDTNPEGGLNFYRILQQDLDGKESFSKVVKVNIVRSGNAINVYPNPAVGGAINIKLSKASIVQVYNAWGLLMLQKSFTEGVHAIQLNHLTKGIYTIRANGQTARVLWP